jgi:hypothetical protein
MPDLDSIPSRFDLAYSWTQRDLAGHDPNGTLIDDPRGAFYFHEKVGGHGQGVVTRLWNLANDEHVLDTISTDCRSIDDAFAVVDEHCEEMACLSTDLFRMRV